MANTASASTLPLTATAAGSQAPYSDAAMDTVVTITTGEVSQRVVDALAATVVVVAAAMTPASLVDASMDTAVGTSWAYSLAVTRYAQMDTVIVVNTEVPVFGTGGDAWALNWETQASSKYESFSFNSFASIGGRDYGADSGGLYLLGAEDDDGEPIQASVNVGLQRFGSDNLKRMVSAYAQASSSDKLQLKVSYSDSRGAHEYIYAADHYDEFQRMQRFVVGRGIKANYIGLEIFNLDGSDFELNKIVTLTSDMERRI